MFFPNIFIILWINTLKIIILILLINVPVQETKEFVVLDI